ncbi:MAG: OmpA family protein [Magnetovibrionaceae bacterium]
MKALKFLAVAAALPVLGACAQLGDYDFDKTAGMSAGSTFGEELKTAYLGLATSEAGEQDWKDADFFHTKAKRSVKGPVGPQDVADRLLPDGPDQDLANAYASLTAVLNAGAGTSNPKMAAMAQTSYDCWLQEQEENIQPEDIEACKKNFEIAMAALGAAPTPIAMGPYTVYFGLGSSAVDATSSSELMKVVDVYKAGGVSAIQLTGHTDTSGNPAANRALSEKRAAAVASALRANGVPGSAIMLSYDGEAAPQVATGDGVAERLNRRVEITLKP